MEFLSEIRKCVESFKGWTALIVIAVFHWLIYCCGFENLPYHEVVSTSELIESYLLRSFACMVFFAMMFIVAYAKQLVHKNNRAQINGLFWLLAFFYGMMVIYTNASGGSQSDLVYTVVFSTGAICTLVPSLEPLDFCNCHENNALKILAFRLGIRCLLIFPAIVFMHKFFESLLN